MHTDVWKLELRYNDAFQSIVSEWYFFGPQKEAIEQAKKAKAFFTPIGKGDIAVVTECDDVGNPCGDTVYQE